MMNIFKKAEMQVWEIGLIKMALFFMGIAVGANWPEIFGQYVWPLFIVGIAAGLYTFYIWMKK
jgi:hypothetical protein